MKVSFLIIIDLDYERINWILPEELEKWNEREIKELREELPE